MAVKDGDVRLSKGFTVEPDLVDHTRKIIVPRRAPATDPRVIALHVERAKPGERHLSNQFSIDVEKTLHSLHHGNQVLPLGLPGHAVRTIQAVQSGSGGTEVEGIGAVGGTRGIDVVP